MAIFEKGNITLSIEHISELEVVGDKYYVVMDNGFNLEVTAEEYESISSQME